MTTKSPYSDEELTAFLDGELDDAASAAIESRLASDPGLQARLDLLAAPTQQIRQAFDALLTLSPPPPPPLAAAPP
ncbi:MAG: anti-sigma factor family protein, partial [Neomegalonema sp.]